MKHTRQLNNGKSEKKTHFLLVLFSQFSIASLG